MWTRVVLTLVVSTVLCRVVVVNNTITVNDREFFVRGVAYSPVPAGQSAVYSYPYGDYFTEQYKPIWERDLPLIRSMGANTLRIYAWNTQVSHTAFLDYVHSFGLKVIVTYFLGTSQDTPISTPQQRQLAVDAFAAEVHKYLGHPAILGWSFGNEINGAWNGFLSSINDYSDCSWSAELNPKGCLYDQGIDNACSKPIECVYRGFFDFIGQAAAAAHELMSDHQHLVLTSFADVDFIEDRIRDFAASIDGIDAWGLQVYRGKDFGAGDQDVLSTFPVSVGKPLIITEFGVDAYRDPCGVCSAQEGCPSPCHNHLWDNIKGFGEDEATHLEWNLNLFNLIVQHRGKGVVGGSIMAWVDEYWKTAVSVKGCNPTEWSPDFSDAGCEWKAHTNCPNANISENSLCGYWLYSTFDKYVNEGWFGLNRVNIAKPVDTLSPRSIFFALRDLFTSHFLQEEQKHCAPLNGQCGGEDWKGTTCCAGEFVQCQKKHRFFSQCERICPSDEPCWTPGVGCSAANHSVNNGNGRDYCAAGSRCTDWNTCYEDDPNRCDCAKNAPCKIQTSPMTCVKQTSKGCPHNSVPCVLSKHDQCGGMDYTGPNVCPTGTTCKVIDSKFSKCL